MLKIKHWNACFNKTAQTKIQYYSNLAYLTMIFLERRRNFDGLSH